MNITLCFASYQDIEGMYYNKEIDLKCKDLDEFNEEVNNYYKGIGVEEYLLADVWSDNNEILDLLAKKYYQEHWSSFMKILEDILEYQSILECDENIVSACIQNYGSSLTMYDLKEYCERCTIHSNAYNLFEHHLEPFD